MAKPAAAAHEHGHDHGDAEAPRELGALVDAISQHSEAIAAAFSSGKQDDAHGPLHEIGHLIQKLPDAAAQSDLPESDWTEVKQAADQLMTAFGKVDSLFHGSQDGVIFDQIESDVTTAMEVLRAKAAMISIAKQEQE